MLGIISRFPSNRNGFRHFAMREVSMVASASAIHETRGFEVSDTLPNVSWHPYQIVAEVPWQSYLAIAEKVPRTGTRHLSGSK